jgi:hypothetical protein
MTGELEKKDRGKPWHLWVIGIVGLLWNSIGVLGFLLTQMGNEAAFASMSLEQREYFESFPLWAVAFWAIGVFGGVLGCLLMVLGKRVAVPVLVASAAGALVANYGGLFLLGGLEVMGGPPALVFPTVIIVLATALALYARAMSKKGILS